MFDLEEQIPQFCHSGGASGSDTVFETISNQYGIQTLAYSYKTPSHKTLNKVEITEEDYLEGVEEILSVKKQIGRRINRDFRYMNLLARNWPQVKYSQSTWAIGRIEGLNVAGGTGWAVAMSKKHQHPTHIFNQDDNKWYEWSYVVDNWIPIKCLKITTKHFAGIGTRKISDTGIQAIETLLKNSFE